MEYGRPYGDSKINSNFCFYQTYDKYGWDVDEDNNFVENEEEQYWIEYMKVRHEEDEISISQIARELNTCDVPTKRGGTWSHKQVSRILNRGRDWFNSQDIKQSALVSTQQGIEILLLH